MDEHTSRSDMPGGGRSNSLALRIVGATVALIVVFGYLSSGWSWGSGSDVLTTIGGIVAVSIIGWSFYRIESMN
jgi:hypothetical protein